MTFNLEGVQQSCSTVLMMVEVAPSARGFILAGSLGPKRADGRKAHVRKSGLFAARTRFSAIACRRSVVR